MNIINITTQCYIGIDNVYNSLCNFFKINKIFNNTMKFSTAKINYILITKLIKFQLIQWTVYNDNNTSDTS